MTLDEHGIAHACFTRTHRIHGGHNNIVEEDIECTLCDIEIGKRWRRAEHPVTCIPCLSDAAP